MKIPIPIFSLVVSLSATAQTADTAPHFVLPTLKGKLASAEPGSTILFLGGG